MEGEGRKAEKSQFLMVGGNRRGQPTSHLIRCLKSFPMFLPSAGASKPSYPLHPPIILPSTSSRYGASYTSAGASQGQADPFTP